MCFVYSILQGAWLYVLWQTGRDRSGSAVRQGPGRALLCQPGPQQRPDGHGSPDLASGFKSHYSPPACLPTCLSDWCTVSKTCSTSTWTDSQPLACWADLHQQPLEKHVTCSDNSKQCEHAQTTQPSLWLGTTQCTLHTQTWRVYFEFSENERDSEVSFTVLWELLHLWTRPPPSSTLTLTRSFPSHRLMKLWRALFISLQS